MKLAHEAPASHYNTASTATAATAAAFTILVHFFSCFVKEDKLLRSVSSQPAHSSVQHDEDESAARDAQRSHRHFSLLKKFIRRFVRVVGAIWRTFTGGR